MIKIIEKKTIFNNIYHNATIYLYHDFNLKQYIIDLNIIYKTQEEQLKNINIYLIRYNFNSIKKIYIFLKKYVKNVFYNLKCKSRHDEINLNHDFIEKLNIFFVLKYKKNNKSAQWYFDKKYNLSKLFYILDL